jgi:hypothetical protein
VALIGDGLDGGHAPAGIALHYRSRDRRLPARERFIIRESLLPSYAWSEIVEHFSCRKGVGVVRRLIVLEDLYRGDAFVFSEDDGLSRRVSTRCRRRTEGGVAKGGR